MICILALVVFGVLGIFSATHRKIAFEAFDCVFRKITLRKCETGLDTRLKSQITGKFLKFNPKTGRFVYKHFEVISWIFTILFFVSLAYTIVGGVNYYLYGNCNGPNSDGFCVFDPTGQNSKVTAPDLCVAENVHKELGLNGFNESVFPVFNKGAPNKVIFIGCYACEYTRKAYPNIRKLLERDDVEFIFAHFPVKSQTDYMSDYVNCIYSIDKNKLIDFNDKTFLADEPLVDEEDVQFVIDELNIDEDELNKCLKDKTIKDLHKQQLTEIEKTGIYGTPLVFVNSKPVVGPKPYRVYKRLLK